MNEEDKARKACEMLGWIDMRDDEESESTFFNEKKEIYDMQAENWMELAYRYDIFYRIGWREFECPECCKFTWPSRDCYSPSAETCPKCGECLCPRTAYPDPFIPHDDMGNITVDNDWKHPKKETSAVFLAGNIPFNTVIPEGTPLRDATGSDIGRVTKCYHDDMGRLNVKVSIDSIIADGLFEVSLGISEDLDL